MLIGIISDTHGSLPPSILTTFEDCAHIIHAGDVGASSVIERLRSIAPITAVRGNCDSLALGLDLKWFATVVLDGVRFFVTHTPLDAQVSLHGHGFIAPQQPLPHVCVHGHTHITRNERQGAVLVLCPGSPVSPRAGNDPTVMLVKIEDSGVAEVQVVKVG